MRRNKLNRTSANGLAPAVCLNKRVSGFEGNSARRLHRMLIRGSKNPKRSKRQLEEANSIRCWEADGELTDARRDRAQSCSSDARLLES
jgi:hypothetical protein